MLLPFTFRLNCLRCSLFWVVTQYTLIVVYRHFETAHRYNLQWSSSQRRLALQFKVGTINSPQTFVSKYPNTLCKISEERRPSLHRGWKTEVSHEVFYIFLMAIIIAIRSTTLFLVFIKPVIFQEEEKFTGNPICRLLQPPLASKTFTATILWLETKFHSRAARD